YAVSAGFLHQRQNRLPGILLARNHERDHQRPVRPVALDLLDLAQIGLQLAVGDELYIVEAEKPPIRPPDRAVTRSVDVDDRRPFLAQRLPDDATPTCPESTHDIVFLVGRRS